MVFVDPDEAVDVTPLDELINLRAVEFDKSAELDLSASTSGVDTDGGTPERLPSPRARPRIPLGVDDFDVPDDPDISDITFGPRGDVHTDYGYHMGQWYQRLLARHTTRMYELDKVGVVPQEDRHDLAPIEVTTGQAEQHYERGRNALNGGVIFQSDPVTLDLNTDPNAEKRHVSSTRFSLLILTL